MSPETIANAPAVVLVRYGELALKGGNRGEFEKTLVRNIQGALEPISEVEITRERGRISVRPRRRLAAVARRLQEVFGIVSVSPAWLVEATPEAIVRAARPIYAEARAAFPPERTVTFRVRGSRGDKHFPMTSSELERYVADRVLPEDGSVAVELEAPMLELGIDVRPEHAFVFAERLPGPGGLPVGTLGRTLCLISGGIDSPVAAWMTMKRGAEVAFVTFHSAPYVGEPSVRKVEDLVRVLARWQPRTRLFVAPFGPVQEAIRDAAPEGYRTVLYRRMMQRIAARLAAGTGAGALVTGESLGQVASQTLENLTCIEAAADLPVLRPLVAFDKQETIALARRIGTFELSCLPEPDCCTVFMPRRPVIRGRPEVCLEIESGYDVQGLTDAAVERVEVRDLA